MDWSNAIFLILIFTEDTVSDVVPYIAASILFENETDINSNGFINKGMIYIISKV